MPFFTVSKEQLLSDLERVHNMMHKPKRGKRIEHTRWDFEHHLETELPKLCNELYNRTYRPSANLVFISHKGGRHREVFSAHFRDRVVHRLYYEYTHKLYESSFIGDSYSGMKGRGTLFGVKRLQHHCAGESNNYKEPCYILRLDIKGYFMHINRATLKSICLRKLDKLKGKLYDGKPWYATHDYELVKFLTCVFCDAVPTANCYKRGTKEEWAMVPREKSLFYSPAGIGLPVGSLVSQLFANIYLNEFDQYCKRVLKCRRYGRYVDDAYIVYRDREHLKALLPKMRQFLKDRLGLELHPTKTCITNLKDGVLFLGGFIKPWRMYVSSVTVKRMRKNLKEIDVKNTSLRQLRLRLSSFSAVYKPFNSKNVRKDVLNNSNDKLCEVGYFVQNYRIFHIYQSYEREYKERKKQKNSVQ